jgi:hypothetical protein
MLLNCTSFGPLNYETTINEKPESVRQESVVVGVAYVPAKAEENAKFYLEQDADGEPHKYEAGMLNTTLIFGLNAMQV